MGKKGNRIRPCHVCGVPVNFIPWKEESIKRGRKIWHWANENGTHHIHKEKTYDESVFKQHLREISRWSAPSKPESYLDEVGMEQEHTP